jgi:hypothetical protein
MRIMMRDNQRARWVIALAVLGISTAAIAEDVMVKYQSAIIHTGKSGHNQTVATLKRGEKMQVLAKEGDWLKVKAGDKQGYVQANYVIAAGSNNNGGGFAGLTNLVAGSPGSAEATGSAAAKGVDDSVKWAQSNSKSTAGLDRMLALRETLIKDGDWEKFTSQGNVGPAKK